MGAPNQMSDTDPEKDYRTSIENDPNCRKKNDDYHSKRSVHFGQQESPSPDMAIPSTQKKRRQNKQA